MYQVKDFAAKLNILNSIPRSHVMERENQSFPSSICMDTHREHISRCTKKNFFV